MNIIDDTRSSFIFSAGLTGAFIDHVVETKGVRVSWALGFSVLRTTCLRSLTLLTRRRQSMQVISANIPACYRG